ncbi:MAG: archease [Planctomycetota bacterium]|nr:archease [Planctomycetota bacterium]MDI6788739.1 archease [Planctomycetota bacterium]
MKYQLIHHTADIGIKVRDKTLKGLFEKSAFALYDILCDIKKVKPLLKKTISVQAPTYEEILNEFLNALLKEFTVQNNLVASVTVNKIEKPTGSLGSLQDGNIIYPSRDSLLLSATIHLQRYSVRQHLIKTEIKAVTFHNLYVKKIRDGYMAEVIFDV